MSTKAWRDSAGKRPHTVSVYERPDKGYDVYLRWNVGSESRYQKAQVGRVRDERNRLVKRLQDHARAEAEAKSEELRANHGSGRGVTSAPAKLDTGESAPTLVHTPAQATESIRTAAAGGERITFEQGIKLAFSLEGCYPLDPETDAHTKQFRALADEAAGIISRAHGDLSWDEITPGIIRFLWRTVHSRSRAGEGYRKAEKMVTCIRRIATFLEEEFPGRQFVPRMKGWRAELREYWAKHGTTIDGEQPRHSPEDLRALLLNLDKADPRVRLSIVLGAELRGGQVVRTFRSHCKLGPKDWRVSIPSGSRRKRAPTLVLNDREEAELREALETGYLADLESAFRAGEIPDYPLFPAGRIGRSGRKRVSDGLKPMHNTTLVKLLHKFELDVGIEPKLGQGWHGLRRSLSDIAEEVLTDERVKDQIGGWSAGSDMRRKVYQKKLEDERTLTATAEGRAKVRAFVEGRIEPDVSSPTPDDLERTLRMVHLLLLAGNAAGALTVVERFQNGDRSWDPNCDQPAGEPGGLVTIDDASACGEVA